jgi:TonB family protein
MKRATVLKMPDPAFPSYPGKDQPKGSAMVSITVLANGSVGEVQLIAGGTFDLAEQTRADMKKWKFKPAMCGSEPVVSDVEVVVTSNNY